MRFSFIKILLFSTKEAAALAAGRATWKAASWRPWVSPNPRHSDLLLKNWTGTMRAKRRCLKFASALSGLHRNPSVFVKEFCWQNVLLAKFCWNLQPPNNKQHPTPSNHTSDLKAILHPCIFYGVEAGISQNAATLQLISATAGSRYWLKWKPKLL